ncbi:MAG: hypothetical protein WC732_04665 [Candidatus Omnitrophota bacterium]
MRNPQEYLGLRRVKKDLYKTTGILPYYRPNELSSRLIRGNSLMDSLAEKVFDHPELLVLLRKKVAYWLSWDHSDFTFCLAGSVYYLAEQYKKAEQLFLKGLAKNTKNIDLWLDLAFSLYHQGTDKQELAREIIFSHKELAALPGPEKLSLTSIKARLKIKRSIRPSSSFPLQGNEI